MHLNEMFLIQCKLVYNFNSDIFFLRATRERRKVGAEVVLLSPCYLRCREVPERLWRSGLTPLWLCRAKRDHGN